MLRPAAVALLLMFAPAVGFADAPCPVSCTYNNTIGAHCSTAAAHDSSSSEDCYPYPGTLTSHVEYDLTLGTVLVSAGSCTYSGNGHATVYAKDRYRLVGPAGGGSVAFEAIVSAYGSASGFGSVGVGLTETGGGTTSVNEGDAGGFNQYLVLPLSHPVGEEFELEVSAYASAELTALAQATLFFSSLPPGYGVASCQGFTGGGAVAARTASWGALKLRYR